MKPAIVSDTVNHGQARAIDSNAVSHYGTIASDIPDIDDEFQIKSANA